MAKKAGARYLDSSITVQNKTLRGRLSLFLAAGAALVAILGTIFMGALVAYSSVDTNRTVLAKADAALNFCGVIGQNMDGRSSWRANWDVALADANQRRFTLSEVVPNSTWWSHFSGAGSGDGQEGAGKWNEVVDEVNAGRPDSAKLPKTEDLPAPLHENRNLASCTLGTIPGAVGSFGINFANFVTKIASFVSTMAFNSSFICDADGVPAGSVCVDLVKVIGGRGNDAGQGGSGQGGNSGIIGSLTSGLYMPLMVIVVLITALSVFWTGIVKRKYRDALFQAIWLFASVIVGLALLLNPSMLVKAPMVAGNTVVGCVVGSFNGTGCFGGNSGGGSVGSNAPTARENICASSASGITAEQTATLYVNSMSCAIWSAFVLEPYAQGAFGVSLSQLDLDSVIDASNGQTVRELLSSDGWSPPGGFTPENICVNLQSNNSYRGMGSTFQGASNTTNGTAGAVCNLAVWDLFMKTNAVGGGVTSANNNPDNQWLSVMSRLPANQDLWNNYTGDTSGLSKIAMGVLAAFASLLGSALIILVSVMALAYYVIAIVMVAFAPVFFLLGMHPGRGRKIMLGWVEQIVGNILKYIISAVFLLIAITFYGAILGTTETLLGSLLFVTIITVALFLYRKELISLLSRVEMGGEKVADFGSKTSEIGQKIGGAVWRPTRAVAAGAIAGAATGAGTRVGAQAAISRELRRGNGLGARAWQAADAISKDNADDLYKTEVAKQKDADIAQKTATQLERDAERAVKELDPIAGARDAAEENLVNANSAEARAAEELSTKQRLDVEVMTQFPEGDYARKRADKTFEVEDEDGNKRSVTSSDAFKNINDTTNQLSELRAKRAELLKAGDKTADSRFTAEENALEQKLKVDIASFKSSHKLGGSANAYVDLKQAEGIRDDYELSRKEALRTGNKEEAAEMERKISAIDLQINSQRSVYEKVYGAAELKTATDQYDRTTDEYIKHRIPLQDQDEVRALSKKTYGELNDEVINTRKASAKASEAKDTADLKYDDARDKAGERITAASEARTDAEFRKAEAAHLAEARKNITPGEIVTAGAIKKTLDEAEAYAGVQAARNSNFGKDLRETIEKLNEREAESSLVPEVELPSRPVVRGENVRAAEERNPGRVDAGDYRAGKAAVAETAGKITAAEREVAEAEAQVQRETQRAQRDAERARRGSASEALQAAKEQARAAANKANNDYFTTRGSFDEAERKLNTLRADDISNGSGLPSQDLLRAEAERDEIQSRLTNLDQAKRQADRQYAEASRALVESSRTQALVDAENRLTAAKAQAEEIIPKFERQVSIPSATFKSVETDQNMVNKLNEIQDSYNALAASVRAGGNFSTEDKAKLVEVERRIANLGANPTQGAVTQIVNLLPAEPKDKGASSRAQAQQPSGALPDIAPMPQPRQQEPATALPDFESAPRRPQPTAQPQPQAAPNPEPVRPAPSAEPARPAPAPAPEPQRPAPQPESQPAPRPRERPAPQPEQRGPQTPPVTKPKSAPTPDGPLPDLNDTAKRDTDGGRNSRPRPGNGDRKNSGGRGGAGEGNRFNPNGNGGRGGNNGPGDINPPPKNNR